MNFLLQIRLDVQHKPEIEQSETFIHSRDGDEVEITCIIHASPPARVEWYRNGQLLNSSDVVISERGNRQTLMLHSIGRRPPVISTPLRKRYLSFSHLPRTDTGTFHVIHNPDYFLL